jgi:hypothetical protein
MNAAEYERIGGFSLELGNVRRIGQDITSLERTIPAREHQPAEVAALARLKAALEEVRTAIIETRRTVQ